jgi:signal transduction histidine kinase/ActR/RegA family two-component response regulator
MAGVLLAALLPIPPSWRNNRIPVRRRCDDGGVAWMPWSGSIIRPVLRGRVTVGEDRLDVLGMRIARRPSRRVLTVLAVAGFALVVGLTTTLSGVWTGLENGSIDLRFDLRPATRPSDVVVVGVDDATFNHLGLQWPFPRRLDAEAIDRLRADGARTIVYDVQFTEPTDARDDNELYDAVARAGNVVLATSEVDAAGHTDVLGGDANVARAHARAAAANLIADGSGVFRKYPYEVNRLESLAVVTAQRAGHPVSERSFASRAAWIDFRGPPGTIREIPFWELLAGRVPRSTFAGKVVVVGATSPTLGDVHPTPVGDGQVMSGPEIQANAIWTALHDNPLRSAPAWAAILAVLLAAVFVPLLSLRARLAVWAGGVVALAAVYAGVAQIAFDHGLIIPVVGPLVAWGIAAVGSLVASYLAAHVYGRILEREVLRRTEELRASQREVVMARDEALEASRLKSAFLANMSHEIRTPMNGVIGMNDLLLMTALDDEQRAFAEQVARSSEQMMTVISDILDIAKIEKGTIKLELDDFDLYDIVQQACVPPELEATAKRVTLAVQIATDVPRWVYGDGGRIRQVLLNLIHNAVKFTDQGAVDVHVGRASADALSGVRFEVRDSGIGIDPSNVERMFQPFIQADISMTRGYSGNGLGLAISKELVERMGGTIGAESQLGRGSTFYFELDLPEAKEPSARSGDQPDLPVAAPGPASDQPVVPAAEPLRASAEPLILLAEDSPVNRDIAIRLLERGGFRVCAVGDGREALDALEVDHFDAVLIGCQLAELDGYAVTRELRRREADSRHTPVIAMSGQAIEGVRERCLQAGMDDHLTKPVHAQALHDTLRRWIAQAPVRDGAPQAGPKAASAIA